MGTGHRQFFRIFTVVQEGGDGDTAEIEQLFKRAFLPDFRNEFLGDEDDTQEVKPRIAVGIQAVEMGVCGDNERLGGKGWVLQSADSDGSSLKAFGRIVHADLWRRFFHDPAGRGRISHGRVTDG